MEDAASLCLEARFNTIELAGGGLPGIGGSGEQGLLVEEIRAQQRVVAASSGPPTIDPIRGAC